MDIHLSDSKKAQVMAMRESGLPRQPRRRRAAQSAREAAHCGRAFTLIELLVVVAVIAILLSILLPALNSAKHKAKEVVCSSQLRQIGLLQLQYTNDFNGYFPINAGDSKGDSTWPEALRRGGYAGSDFYGAVGAGHDAQWSRNICMCPDYEDPRVFASLANPKIPRSEVWFFTTYAQNRWFIWNGNNIDRGVKISQVEKPELCLLAGENIVHGLYWWHLAYFNPHHGRRFSNIRVDGHTSFLQYDSSTMNADLLGFPACYKIGGNPFIWCVSGSWPY